MYCRHHNSSSYPNPSPSRRQQLSARQNAQCPPAKTHEPTSVECVPENAIAPATTQVIIHPHKPNQGQACIHAPDQETGANGGYQSIAKPIACFIRRESLGRKGSPWLVDCVLDDGLGRSLVGNALDQKMEPKPG